MFLATLLFSAFVSELVGPLPTTFSSSGAESEICVLDLVSSSVFSSAPPLRLLAPLS